MKRKSVNPPSRPSPQRPITAYFRSSASASPVATARAYRERTGPSPAFSTDQGAEASAAATGEQPSSSISLRELRLVDRRMAVETVNAMKTGYTTRSKQSVPTAEVTDLGCWLAAKGSNRQENGYVAVAPKGLTATLGGARPSRATKALPQGIHRLAVIAHKSQADINHLLYDGWHASHLCHHPTCFNPAHITVEAKADNEARKSCRGRTIWRVRAGERVLVCPPPQCLHQPRCLFETEEREASITAVGDA